MANTESGLATRALTGPAEECGDAGVLIERDGWLFAALVDGLGHGPRAARIAALATAYLEGHCAQPLVALLDGLHEELKSTQGAVACLCRLDLASGELSMAGIGNITCRIFTGLDSERLLSRDGVLGYMHATPKEYTRRLAPHSLLLLHSDGVREHFQPYEHPGILKGAAGTVAAQIVDKFGKGDDDASCLAVRYRR